MLPTAPPPARAQAAVAPFLVIWEVTQACDLACVHCRAAARPERSRWELSTAEGEDLIRQVRDLGRPASARAQPPAPLFVLTGGDPIKRPDIFHLVEYGTGVGVRMSLTPSVTPLLTPAALRQLKVGGLARLALSLDGSSAAVHDRFRGVPGAFTRTIETLAWAREAGLPVQINSTLSRHNLGDFDALAALVASLDIVLWSVFFLVPVGRGQVRDCLPAEEIERLFAKLYALSARVRFDIKTTEAMHYRRYLVEQRRREPRAGGAGARPGAAPRPADGIGRAPRGINGAKGFVFISHRGDVYPSGFLPLAGGNIRRQPLAEIYQKSPLFRALRDASRLRGKCGVCEFRELCGGSRARAYALTGDPFASDPSCAYVPSRWQRAQAEA